MSYKKKYRKKNYIKYKKMRYKYKRKNVEELIINILAVVVIIMFLMYIKNKFFSQNKKITSIQRENIEAFAIPDRTIIILKELSDKYKMDFPEVLTLYSFEEEFYKSDNTTKTIKEIENDFIKKYGRIKKKYKNIEPYKKMFASILDDIKIFPIPKEDLTQRYQYTFNDTWGSKRNYGGERGHMGTDIMDKKNISGKIPILSMTDGEIENIGWNELGGFRIGIKASSNNYYYYAHFDSFDNNLKKGDKITAGQFLGFMGDTGYSKQEGTKGNFAVHLHVGISPDTKLFNDEFWINPYAFLRLVEDKKIYYNIK